MGAMRRSAMLLAAMLALSGALAAGAAATGGSEPKLTIVRAAPLTVRGTGFAASERVRLTIRATTRTVVRSVRAGTGGAFTLRVPCVRIWRCGDAPITAVGTRGDRARLVRHRGVASCNPA
jgi:hypothetical protein